MAETAAMNGAEWLARALAGTGMSHVFFVESVMRRTLLQLSDHGVKPVLAHSEKAAAYMADGYARVARRPGVCMAQSVGAANLASGLQDPWLGRSPVIALTGHKEPSFQHRNSYQEIPHAPLFSAVTKFSTPVYATSELPRLLRHAWRAALSDTPRPTHLDFNGLQGDVIELGQTAEPPVMETVLPTAALDGRIAIVGTAGSGKTYTAKGLVERLLDAGARVTVVDPLGVWWGLRAGASDNAGYSVVVFGGRHADVPITAEMGAPLGQLIARQAPASVVDLSELGSNAVRRQFMAAFSEAIYEANEEPLHLVFDEADLWAPQRPIKGWEGLLGHIQEIVRRGRGRGLRPR